MDFSWTDQQRALREAVVAFAQRELNDEDLIDRDLQLTFPADAWRKCAAFGIQGLAIPEAYGGQGHDLLTATLAMEGLGYGCRDNGLTFALSAMFVSFSYTLLEAGSEEQKQRVLPGICDGSTIGAYAMTEPEAGSDAFSLQTRARRVEGGYRLSGKKILLTLGPVADYFLVFATADPALKQWGISLFLVARETPGLSVTETMPKMGLRTTPIGELTLDDCFVPEENLVGEEGSGASIFKQGQNLERASIMATQLGIMEYQLERAVDYARSRTQFGKPIGKFQAVSHRLAEMKLRLEVARLLAYRAVWRIQEGLPATTDASLANIYMADSFVQSSLDAIMVHGGRGYLTATEVERDLRDAVGGPVYGGTSDIQRNIVASQLGL